MNVEAFLSAPLTIASENETPVLTARVDWIFYCGLKALGFDLDAMQGRAILCDALQAAGYPLESVEAPTEITVQETPSW